MMIRSKNIYAVLRGLHRQKEIFSRPIIRDFFDGRTPGARRTFKSAHNLLRRSVISSNPKSITVSSSSGKRLSFHNLWLRDHCQCTCCVHQETRQRQLDTFTIPRDIRAESVSAEPDALRVTWSNDNDQHESLYPWSWLEHHHEDSSLPKRFWNRGHHKTHWGRDILGRIPAVQFEDVMRSEDGVAEWTAKIFEYGICYVNGCPVDSRATQALLERIAYIRHTHYGGFWDFTSDLKSKDTAYTTLALPAHTDTTYFSDPAGLQMFHLLHHHSGTGGRSLLVDGFRAAEKLKAANGRAYEVLSQFRVPAHASGNAGISIQPAVPFPVFNHHPVSGDLVQIRWNNSDRATIRHQHEHSAMEDWYDAAREWVELMTREEAELWDQLEPGRPLIFDNWRVLHGRSAFTGARRMCGGYINYDDFMSRYHMTDRQQEDIFTEL